ncbi:cytochrome P450 [Polychytrium aggregatum]|uniref:cytochrome P450 n=1 Tax=Polychytrium aggregatum TaxID=110093 RepID=UPI0022FDE5DE|nr:cytochrome P450 [Polychytrium aggregatum]KAI9202284.1 cytochrome P450 [Polychytrium aggregatum]
MLVDTSSLLDWKQLSSALSQQSLLSIAGTSSLVAAAYFGGRLVYRQYLRFHDEPPLVSGWMPFMGAALTFSTLGPELLQTLRKTHGECFTLFVAGRRMTFVLDPFTHPTITKNTTDLRFRDVVEEINDKAFLTPPHALTHIHDDVHIQYKKLLHGAALDQMMVSFTDQLKAKLQAVLQDLPRATGPDAQWTQLPGFFEFCRKIFFHATTRAIFGEAVDPTILYDGFAEFDRNFAALMFGGPEIFVQHLRRLQHQLASDLRKAYDSEDNTNISQIAKARHETFSRSLSTIQHDQLQFSLLWAAASNTLLAASWTLALIVSNPEWHAAVKAEIAAVQLKQSQNGSDSTESSASADDAKATEESQSDYPILMACISESLRLTAIGLFNRIAAKDQILTIKSTQQQFRIRKGDTIACVPYATHRDAEVYPNPKNFDPSRFLASSDTKFVKDGRPVRNNLTPFGGGPSMCPGRVFARREIQHFVIQSLLHADFELLQPVPEFDTRPDYAILPPQHDIPFQLRVL